MIKKGTEKGLWGNINYFFEMSPSHMYYEATK
jgi:hypothetical protein